MTGLYFRLGAGCWGPGMATMLEDAYTARFADHWVFEGTGLTDGDEFARARSGYETDAADIVDVGGVPRATGRDGTPPSFAVLATADLRHWSEHGQGGAATMGVFESGAGTVFNAGTVNWGAELADPVVARITRNVLDRLAGPRTRLDRDRARDGVRALAGSGGRCCWPCWPTARWPYGRRARRTCRGSASSLHRAWSGRADGRRARWPARGLRGHAAGTLLCRPLTDAGAVDGMRHVSGRTVSLAACDRRLFALARGHRVDGGAGQAAANGRDSAKDAVASIAAANGRLFAIDER